jgi:hypothetical protein
VVSFCCVGAVLTLHLPDVTTARSNAMTQPKKPPAPSRPRQLPTALKGPGPPQPTPGQADQGLRPRCGSDPGDQAAPVAAAGPMAQQEERGLTRRTAEWHDVDLPDVIPVAFGTGGGWETHQRSRQLSAGLQDLHQSAMPRFGPRPGARGSRWPPWSRRPAAELSASALAPQSSDDRAWHHGSDQHAQLG